VPLESHHHYIQTYAELEYNNLIETHWPRIQEEIRKSGNVYWSDIVTEIARRGKALADAGCPPKGSEAWVRLVTPTAEQCEEYNAVIRAQWKKDWENAALLATPYAVDIAALSIETLVDLCPCIYTRTCDQRGPIWKALTALLPTETLRNVEAARDKEDRERREEGRREDENFEQDQYLASYYARIW